MFMDKTVKMLWVLKTIYRFSAIPNQNSNRLFAEVEKVIPKFIWNCKRPPDSQNNIKKEEQSLWTHIFQS